jgi:hypothetical protein
MGKDDVSDIVQAIQLTMERDEARGVDWAYPIFSFAHANQALELESSIEWIRLKQDVRASTPTR